ncbi:MAG: ABC transporter ATP-binding protein, partial [Terriglobales bacterium]
MSRVLRLLRYAAHYWPQLGASVVLLALVGVMDAFRVLLIGPIFDRVLNPAAQTENILLFTLPGSGQAVYLQQLMP